MKEEIIGGIRNALERGESIENAMQTFINAGYSAIEVRGAAGMLAPSATGVLYGERGTAVNQAVQKAPSTPGTKPPSSPPQTSSASSAPPSAAPAKPQTGANAFGGTQPPATFKGKKTAIILAIILIVLVLVLGATLYFGDDLLAKFSS